MRRINSYGPGILVLCTALLILLLGPELAHRLTFQHTQARIVQAQTRLTESTILEEMNASFRDIATLVEPSVVHVDARHEMSTGLRGRIKGYASGSGWVYDDLGHIVTNSHVVADATEIQIQLYDGDLLDAQVVGLDVSTDIAVLKVSPGNLHPAKRSLASSDVQQGDMVFAFGSPFDFRFSMSAGVVSGKGRSVGLLRTDTGMAPGYENFIQVDAAINPGNSGGPLTDIYGRVIGMNTAIATGRDGGFEEGQFAGIGLAIPMSMIYPVVEQIISTGEVQKGFLGVNIVDLNQPIADSLAAQGYRGWGLLLKKVEPGSALAGHGMLAGDVIITLNGQTVAQRRQLMKQLFDSPADTVELNVWRYDTKADKSQRVLISMDSESARELGSSTVLEIDEPISKALELDGFSTKGVCISSVTKSGPAWESGILPGDVITHVNEEVIGSVSQLRSTISSMMPGTSATLTIWRHDPSDTIGDTLTISVPLSRLSP